MFPNPADVWLMPEFRDSKRNSFLVHVGCTKADYCYRYMNTRYMEIAEYIEDIHDLSFGVGVRW